MVKGHKVHGHRYLPPRYRPSHLLSRVKAGWATGGRRRRSALGLITLCLALASSHAGETAEYSIRPETVLREDGWAARALADARARCVPRATEEPVIDQSDFVHDHSEARLRARAEAQYRSAKRLVDRAYYNRHRERFELPVSLDRQRHLALKALPLEERLIASVIRHVEIALYFGYARFITLSDMGHWHFLVPEDFYDRQIEPLSPRRLDLVYSRISAHPETRYLYHTAEHFRPLDLEGIDDRALQWRHFTRSLVGDNRMLGSIHPVLADNRWNTLHKLPGYRKFSGFYLHANADGCFAFRHNGQIRRFDIGLDHPPSATNVGDFN